MIRHLIMFSSGVCSWVEAKRTVARYGLDGVTLLFADVKGFSKNPFDGEDLDNYRFLDEAAANVGAPLVKITRGESLWELFRREKMMANSRFPICSVKLKREILDAWQNEHCDPTVTTLHFGLNWDESHRLESMKAIKAPFKVESLINTEPPFLDKCAMMNLLRAEGITAPRLYAKGFPHANCGGFCVKAGQAQFHLLLKTDPDRYKYHEENEQAFRDMTGKDHSIMKDRTGGQTRTLTMKDFRERIERQGSFDQFEWGGCGCAAE